MFDSASDFRYVAGDLGDIDLSVPLMPDRSAVNDPLYGKDIAFLLEAGVERCLLADGAGSNPPTDYNGNTIGPSNKIPFTRRVGLDQAFKTLSLVSGANDHLEWLDPAATITPQIFAPNTVPCPYASFGSLQSVAGISPRHATSTVDPQQLVRDRSALRRSTIEAAFAAVASRMRCVDTYGGAFHDPGNTGADGYFYVSRYDVTGTEQRDGDGKVTGYTLTTNYDTENSAPANSSVWSMPVRPVHVGMGCELYALLHLEYTNTLYFAEIDDGVATWDSSETSNMIMCLAKFEQQQSPISTVQTLDAFGAWLHGRRVAMMGALGVTRWSDSNRPSPPAGNVLRGCRQDILARIYNVYPVFTITHTNLQENQQQ